MRQPWLPKVKVEKVVDQKFPQPKLPKKVKAPRKFEILYHPFDLRFRGRVNKWLSQVLDTKDWRTEDRMQKTDKRRQKSEDRNKQSLRLQQKKLKEILQDEVAVRAVELYFFPQGKKRRWLNQEEVLKKTKIPYKKKLKRELIEGLMKIWLETRS